MVKALFFDIDGTLVSFDTHSVPDSAARALAQAAAAGCLLFVATGRQIANTECVRHLNFDGYITANGGYCTTRDGATVLKRTFSRRNLDSLFSLLAQEPFPVAMMTSRGWFCNYTDGKVETLCSMVELPVPPVADLKELCRQEEIIEMSLFVDPQQEQRIVSRMDGCISSRWNPISADLNPEGTDKAAGMQAILDHYGLDRSEAMAFGDGGNDIAMLRYAGIGVTFPSASQDVREAADYVTDEVDCDGIYKALKHFKII